MCINKLMPFVGSDWLVIILREKKIEKLGRRLTHTALVSTRGVGALLAAYRRRDGRVAVADAT